MHLLSVAGNCERDGPVHRPFVSGVSSVTIKEWMLFVNLNGGMSFSQERDLEAKLLPWQHHSMCCCDCVFFKVH